MTTPTHPTLYQVNTRVWIQSLSKQLNCPATLDDIALRGCVRTLELEREWGLRPQPGVSPLHPVLTTMTTAIHFSFSRAQISNL